MLYLICFHVKTAFVLPFQCAVDSEVALRVGGNFFFDPQPADSPANLVLIAGGVGINPLFSILLHVADLHSIQGNGYKMGMTNLLYSAKTTHELLFRVGKTKHKNISIFTFAPGFV